MLGVLYRTHSTQYFLKPLNVAALTTASAQKRNGPNFQIVLRIF